jgi:hypothetical protein
MKHVNTMYHHPSFGGEDFLNHHRINTNSAYQDNAYGSSTNYVNTTKSEDKN